MGAVSFGLFDWIDERDGISLANCIAGGRRLAAVATEALRPAAL